MSGSPQKGVPGTYSGLAAMLFLAQVLPAGEGAQPDDFPARRFPLELLPPQPGVVLPSPVEPGSLHRGAGHHRAMDARPLLNPGHQTLFDPVAQDIA
jgi:hypothetical protein